jgi:hypothetical protein
VPLVNRFDQSDSCVRSTGDKAKNKRDLIFGEAQVENPVGAIGKTRLVSRLSAEQEY